MPEPAATAAHLRFFTHGLLDVALDAALHGPLDGQLHVPLHVPLFERGQNAEHVLGEFP